LIVANPPQQLVAPRLSPAHEDRVELAGPLETLDRQPRGRRLAIRRAETGVTIPLFGRVVHDIALTASRCPSESNQPRPLRFHTTRIHCFPSSLRTRIP